MIVEIATDGSAWPNPGPGGWACLLKCKGAKKVLYGWDPQSTSNRMELMAAIKALEHLRTGCKVIMTCDSNYVVMGITQWIKTWKRRGFMTSPFDIKGKSKPSTPVVNKDLWLRLEEATMRHEIEWVWTKGHSTNQDNILCDTLAQRARAKQLAGEDYLELPDQGKVVTLTKVLTKEKQQEQIDGPSRIITLE
jgi:ribonuclease HI